MSVVEDHPDRLVVVVQALRPGHSTPAEESLVAVPSLPPGLPSGQGPVPGTEGWTPSGESLNHYQLGAFSVRSSTLHWTSGLGSPQNEI